LMPAAQSQLQNLSRGETYKAALAGILAVNPEVWLLDEPFASGMDPHGISMFKEHARAAVSEGRTIIYSTQILEVVEKFSDKVIIVHRGELRAFDQIEKLNSGSLNGLSDLFRQF